MDLVVTVLNNVVFYYFYIIAGIIAIVFSIALYVGIKANGTVLIVDQIFKKKDFNREDLKNKYLVQVFYTFAFGVLLLVYILTVPFNGVNTFLFLLGFGILDFAFDFYAIKSSTRV